MRDYQQRCQVRIPHRACRQHIDPRFRRGYLPNYMNMNVLVPHPGARSKAFPAILQRAGKAACFAADEFFAA